MTEFRTYDTADRPTGLIYAGSTGTWVAYARDYNSAGQAADDTSAYPGTTAAPGNQRRYTYDDSGRLTSATDTSAAGSATQTCAARSYSFNIRGDRTSSTSSSVAGTSCTTTTGTTNTYGYDSYSRQLTGANGSGTYSYDAFGRQINIPSSDTPGAGSSIALTYYDNDSIASTTQSGTAVSYTLDPELRRLTATNSGTYHYGGDSDNPNWITQASTTNRYAETLDAVVEVSSNSDSSGTRNRLLLSDLNGATTTTVSIPSSGNATSLDGPTSFDEYGNTTTAATTQTGLIKYGWLGGYHRSTTDTGLQLVGARLYNPVTGRFTSNDPVTGGNENAYNYPDDPINKADITGKKGGWHRAAAWTDSPGRIAAGLGIPVKDVKDAIHAAKKGLGVRGVGARRNPDVEVNVGNGDIRIKGGNGEVEGNINDYLRRTGHPQVSFHSDELLSSVNWNIFWAGIGAGIGVGFAYLAATSPYWAWVFAL